MPKLWVDDENNLFKTIFEVIFDNYFRVKWEELLQTLATFYLYVIHGAYRIKRYIPALKWKVKESQILITDLMWLYKGKESEIPLLVK